MRYDFKKDMTTKSTAAERPRAAAEPGTLVLLCLVSWLIPGAGHLWMGRRQKGIVFLLALPAMFPIGLLLHGRVFPFELSEPLVGLAALANLLARSALGHLTHAGRRRRHGNRRNIRIR